MRLWEISFFFVWKNWDNDTHRIVGVECLQMRKYFFCISILCRDFGKQRHYWWLLDESKKWRRNYLFIWNELFGHNSDCLSSLHPDQRPEDSECRSPVVKNIWTFSYFTSDWECRWPVNSISWPLFLFHLSPTFTDGDSNITPLPSQTKDIDTLL